MSDRLASIFVCDRAAAGIPGFDPERLELSLAGREPPVRVETFRGPCCPNDTWRASLEESAGEPRVLALCRRDVPAPEIQAALRRAGVNPLGVEVIALPQRCRSSDDAALVLGGALERAQAFPGTAPAQERILRPDRDGLSRRGFLSLLKPAYTVVPSIRSSACLRAGTACSDCAEACPEGAVELATDAARVRREACTSCGLCLPACPAGAIELPRFGPREVDAEARRLLAGPIPPRPGDEGRAILLACRHAPDVLLPEGWFRIDLASEGLATPGLVLRLLALGARAVAVAPCQGRCPEAALKSARTDASFVADLLGALGQGRRFGGVLSPIGDGEPWLPARGSAWRTPDPGWAARVPVDAPDSPWQAVASLLEASPAAGVRFDHPASPWGVVEIRRDACTGCESCHRVCSTTALRAGRGSEGVEIRFDPRLCNACGACVRACPERGRRAIRLTARFDADLLAGPETTLYAGQVARCQGCGESIADRRTIERILERLGSTGAGFPDAISRYCPACRSLHAAPAGLRAGTQTDP